jgi:hypothetical protein
MYRPMKRIPVEVEGWAELTPTRKDLDESSDLGPVRISEG